MLSATFGVYSCYYSLNVCGTCLPPNPQHWIVAAFQTPNVLVFGGGAFGKWADQAGSPLLVRWAPFREARKFPYPSATWGYRKKICVTEEASSQWTPKLSVTWSWTSKTLGPWGTNFYSYKLLSLWVLHSCFGPRSEGVNELTQLKNKRLWRGLPSIRLFHKRQIPCHSGIFTSIS